MHHAEVLGRERGEKGGSDKGEKGVRRGGERRVGEGVRGGGLREGVRKG